MVSLGLLLQACEITAPRRSSLLQTTEGGQCVNLGARAGSRALAPEDGTSAVPGPGPATTSIESAMADAPTGAADAVKASQAMTPAAAEIATIIGADALLERMAALDAQARRTGSAADAIAVLRLEQQITHRVLRTMLDVHAVTAHLDCENERGDQLRDQLRKLEDQWSRRVSQASAIIGGMTAFFSGVLGLASAAATTEAVTGIIGGTAESGTALISQSGTARGHLDTEPSALRELWEGPARARMFPASIWRYLNQPVAAGSGQTRREVLLTRWRQRAGTQEGQTVSPVSDAQLALLFGPGGYYTVDDLAARDALIDVVEASIAVMNERLQRLLDELIERSSARGAP